MRGMGLCRVRVIRGGGERGGERGGGTGSVRNGEWNEEQNDEATIRNISLLSRRLY